MTWFRIVLHTRTSSGETFWVQDVTPPTDPKELKEFNDELIQRTIRREADWTEGLESWSADIEEMTPPVELVQMRLAEAVVAIERAKERAEALKAELLRVSAIPGQPVKMVQDYGCRVKGHPKFTANVDFHGNYFPRCPVCRVEGYRKGPERPEGYVEKKVKP